MPVIIKQQGHKSVIRATATETVTLADLKHAGDSTVVGANITQVLWSTAGTITVARGANTKLTLQGNGVWNLREAGMSLTEDAAGTIVITCTGNSTIIIETTKLF